MGHDYLKTPIGWLHIITDENTVKSVLFVDQPSSLTSPDALTQSAKQQLTEYFQKERQRFDLPLAPDGTNFQKNVWKQLMSVSYGNTASYQYIATAIDNPQACRAVGAANGQNPISIIIPCHRIIGASGRLTGYAGGLDRKQWLLQHEAKLNPLGKIKTI